MPQFLALAAYAGVALMLAGAGLWVVHGLRFRRRLEAAHTAAIEAHAQRQHVAYSHARQHFARPRGYRGLGDAALAHAGDRARLGAWLVSLGVVITLATQVVGRGS